VDSSVVGYDGGWNVRDEERRLNSKSGWKPWKPALSSKPGSEKKSGPWRPTKRQVLWAIGMVVALLTTALLIVNLHPEIWKGLLEERNLTLIAIGVSISAIIVLLAIGGAASSWTGFRGKTVWDLLQLLIVPLALAVIGFLFTMQQDSRQQQIENHRTQQAQKIENQRAEAERELAVQRAQDEALQAYLDQMSTLMLDRNLLESEEGDPTHTLAQARTSTVITRLDAAHNRSVTRFLSDSGLAGSLLRGIALEGADLEDADLSGADLEDAVLSDAVLTYTDLGGSAATLEGATMPNGQKYEE
jgi:hypothetical protein